MSTTLELAKKLIACPSLTPDDAGCQKIIAEYLARMQFTIHPMPYGEVKNLWATRGNTRPLLVLAGHTDVVPTGPLNEWLFPPFSPTVHKGHLYGRGSADMKGNLAAMLIACENFLKKHPQHNGAIAWLITSDEEGLSINGTAKVIEHLQNNNEKIDWCIVGEPTSEQTLGDTLKIGRRGSLSGKLTISGIQGHIAYPQLADNPIHNALPALQELINYRWDNGSDFFSPTSLQFSNIHAGTGAGNIIPGHIEIDFNFRYSPAITAEELQKQFEAILKKHTLKFDVNWHHSGNAFLGKNAELATAAINAVQEVMNITPTLSTSGGTSDARFIIKTNCQIIELGVCNSTIHKINECVIVDDLEKLTRIYELIMEQLLITL